MGLPVDQYNESFDLGFNAAVAVLLAASMWVNRFCSIKRHWPRRSSAALTRESPMVPAI
jgi:hypothetical protein